MLHTLTGQQLQETCFHSIASLKSGQPCSLSCEAKVATVLFFKIMEGSEKNATVSFLKSWKGLKRKMLMPQFSFLKSWKGLKRKIMPQFFFKIMEGSEEKNNATV